MNERCWCAKRHALAPLQQPQLCSSDFVTTQHNTHDRRYLINAHSDHELLRAARTGDAPALAELYRRHVEAARGAAYRIAPRLDTDDLVSEAFAKVLQALQRGHGPEASLRPYLFQVIRNTAAEVSQKQQRVSQDVDVQSIPDLSFSPEEEYIDGFNCGAVQWAFARLPERWQEVLWQTQVEGASSKEIATQLGLSPSNVDQIAHRARERLRQEWIAAHISHSATRTACAEALEQIGALHAQRLTKRVRREVELHIAECESCAKASAEYQHVSSHLGRALTVALFGGAVSGSVAAAQILEPADTAQAASSEKVAATAQHGTSKVVAALMAAAAGIAAVVVFMGVLSQDHGAAGQAPSPTGLKHVTTQQSDSGDGTVEKPAAPKNETGQPMDRQASATEDSVGGRSPEEGKKHPPVDIKEVTVIRPPETFWTGDRGQGD